MGSAQRGFVMIALAFPIYLLWKGRLPSYLALMQFQQSNSALGPAAGAVQAATGGTQGLPTSTQIIIPPM